MSRSFVSPLKKRLLLLTAAAVLPLALMAGAGLYFLSVHQKAQSDRVGMELAISIANAVGTDLRGAVTILETLATAPSLDRDDIPAFRERALRIVGVQHEWAAIVVTDAVGAVKLDTRVAIDQPPPAVVDRDSLVEVMQARRAIVGRLVKDGDQWLFAVRAPVLRNGELRHVVTALIRPAAIRDVIARQHLPEDWIVSIIDRDGLRVARSRAHDESLGGRLSDSAQQLLAGGGREGSGITTSLEGDRIFTPFTDIEPFGWTAVLGIPTAAVDAAATQTLVVFGGGVLLSIVLGTLAAGWIARGITGPMGQLRAAAEAVGRREAPQLPETTLGEVREVGVALAQASAELSRYEAERDELLRKERTARETAESANRAKEEFMAVLSHELRTPLNAVYGWARLLQTQQLRDPALITRATDAIVRNADAQVRLIDDLLDLSRISSGKMRLSMQPVQLAEVVQGALDAVRPSADEKGIRIVVASDDASGLVAGDSARLQQIVWNLLANAVKFTPSGGQIMLRQQRSDGHIEISVGDTGQGIAPEMLPHVFDRFRQGDSSSTRSHRGLGLGLALVRELTDLHGGTVVAESNGPGTGSTFTVRLPRATESAALPAVAPMPAITDDALQRVSRLDGLRIVVADDEADALALAETVLSSAGADVRVASSAARAFELVDQCRPHVLVSDLEMPGEDGYSLISRVRARAASDGGTTPAIALSAYGRPQDRVRAIAAGFNMHVPKPVDPGELTAIIAGVAGRAVAPQPSTGHGKMPSSM